MNSLAMIMMALSLVFAIASADSAQPDLYSKTHVTVVDNIPAGTISVHCFSGDDDLGTHQLAYQQNLAWSFRYNILGTTAFFCTINTATGSGSYKVWAKDISVGRCGLDCVWEVEAGGPCLKQTQGDRWCLPWNK